MTAQTATQTTATDATRTAGNATYYLAKTIVVGFAGGCLYFSFTHIIDLAHMLGATGAQAYTAPAFIDGFMLLGRLGMSAAFDASTRKIGRWMMTVGALLSIAANFFAGHTVGDRAIGVMVVIGFLVTEWYAGKLKPAPAAQLTPQQKAAATRARNAAARAAAGQTKAPAKRKPATKTTKAAAKPRRAAAPKQAHPVAAIQALPTTLPVPISGAPVSYNNGLVIAHSLDDIAAYTN